MFPFGPSIPMSMWLPISSVISSQQKNLSNCVCNLARNITIKLAFSGLFFEEFMAILPYSA